MDFFCFSTCSFFSHFIAFDLRLSGSGFDAFFFFDLQLLFPFYCLWYKAVVFCFDGFILFFDLRLLFPFYCLWFKPVGFKLWWTFFVFRLASSFPIFAFHLRLSKSGFDGFFFSNCSFFSHFVPLGLKPSGLAFYGFFLFFDLHLLFPFYCFWLQTIGFRLWWIFFVFRLAASSPILLPLVKGRRVQALRDCFSFSICSFFFHFIAFGYRLSGSGFDGFFLFFDVELLFPFYCPWLKAVGFRLARFFFCFSTFCFFSYFIAFGLRPSGSGFDCFFLFFDLQLLFPFYCLWFKAVGFRLWWIFFVFRLAASSPILSRLVWGLRAQALMDFFCFSTCSFFSHFIAFDLRLSGLGFDAFFLFFDFQLLFPFYCLWYKALVFWLWWIFFVFRLAASFCILFSLV